MDSATETFLNSRGCRRRAPELAGVRGSQRAGSTLPLAVGGTDPVSSGLPKYPYALPTLIILALITGLLLGLLGGGGSILSVPILVYALGFEPKSAIAHSLIIVGLTSLVAAWLHWRQGGVRIRVAVTFGLVAMLGALAGARLAVFVSGELQLVMFAIVMLVAATLMFRGRRRMADAGAGGVAGGSRIQAGSTGAGGVATTGAAAPTVGREGSGREGGLAVVAQAFGVGILTGLLGVGGGFMIVPALALLGGLPMHQAVGTSVLIIGFNGLAGFTGYLGQVPIEWDIVGVFTGCAVLGASAGTLLMRRVDAGSLRKGFAVFLVCVAVFILYQNRETFSRDAANSTLGSEVTTRL